MKVNQQINAFFNKLKSPKVDGDRKNEETHGFLKTRQNKSPESNSPAKRNAMLPPQVHSPAVQVLEQPVGPSARERSSTP
jgi:hypothetical protein